MVAAESPYHLNIATRVSGARNDLPCQCMDVGGCVSDGCGTREDRHYVNHDMISVTLMSTSEWLSLSQMHIT